MPLEFFLVLLALVGFVFLAVWVYARVFDFADAWKKKRGKGTGWGRFYKFAGPPADVEARLSLEETILKQARGNTRSALAGLSPVEARLPPMAPAGR